MNDELIKQFTAYVERMEKVRLLSTPSLEDIAVPDDYSRLLRSNFQMIGEYAGKNREMLDDILFPLLHKNVPLTEDEIYSLNELIRLLANGALTEEIDIHLSELISECLSGEEDKKLSTADKGIDSVAERIDMLNSRVDMLYARLYYIGRSNPAEWRRILGESVRCYKEAFSYLDKDVFGKLPENSVYTLIMLVINGTSMYNTRPHASADDNLELATEQKKWLLLISSMLDDPFYAGRISEQNRKKALLYIHSYFAAFGILNGLTPELYEEAYSYAMQLEEEWKECTVLQERELYLLSIRELQLYTSFKTDSPVMDTCIKNAMDIYESRDSEDYTYNGIIPNLSMANALFLVLSGIRQKYPHRLDEHMEKLVYDIPLNVIRYLHRAPKREDLGQYVNELSFLLERFIELPGGMHIKDFCIHSMAAMHPPTYIHSNMVAKISVCLCKHLLILKPEVFIGFPDCDTAEKVLDDQKRILEYTWYAALFHDIGKLYVIDTIAMYGRRLLDSEFELIQSHPERGAELAERFESMKEYADVIRGHHIWYDESKGYPQNVRNSESPYKAIIDIVSVSDCLDAATDSVGRSYRAGKTIADFKEELNEGAGTRYAPYMKDLFEDHDTHEDLIYLLENGRNILYKETYYVLKGLFDEE